MRILRFVGLLALPLGLLVGGINAASAEVSQAVQQACTPDAMRLCSEFIPDRAKITACMIRRRRELSSECLTAMRGAGGARVRRVSRRGHYVHHYYRRRR
jgi:hypothetical protein